MPYINGLQTGLEGRNSVDTRLSTYPSPFFDPSSAYLPPSYKEMFRWTSYLYLTHSEIAPIINKKCSYVITDLIYETDNPVHTEAWRELLERYIKVQQVEFQMLLDYHVYGNAFASIYYPFERTLTCTTCEEKYSPKLIQWQYREGRFYGACKTCNAMKPMKAEDRPVKNRSRIKVLRWNPKFIDIDYNPFSDRSTYIYRIPKAVRAKISDHTHGRNKAIVTDTPLEILDAVKEKKNLRIAADNIYHFKNITISTDDPSFGMPPLLPVFKDAWLYQTLRKAQEAIAIDHILPLTLITPAPMGGLSPHMEMDLGDWTAKVQRIIKQWRRDQNGIFTLPFPAEVENIRGDANALSVHNDMEHLKQMIAGGLDVPQEFIYGGLNWSGSSVSLRVLENLFLSQQAFLNLFLQEFLVPKLRAYCSLPVVTIKHADFKMADDATQKQIALGLRQTNTISDQTTVEELGFDYDKELKRRMKEEKERLDLMERQQLRAAEIQGQSMVVQARYQSMAQAEAARYQEIEQARSVALGHVAAVVDPTGGVAEQNAPSGQAAAQTGQTISTVDPYVLSTAAEHFLKTYDPQQQQVAMAAMQKSNPGLLQAIKQRQQMISQQVSEAKPLPEQRPPRRKNSPI